jgi:hypothetical protein
MLVSIRDFIAWQIHVLHTWIPGTQARMVRRIHYGMYAIVLTKAAHPSWSDEQISLFLDEEEASVRLVLADTLEYSPETHPARWIAFLRGDRPATWPCACCGGAETPHRSKTACAGVERGRADLITHAGVIKSAPGAGRAASVSEEPTGVPSSPSLHP